MLSAIGETLNIMTLGGLALAVGILVDDATVTIENINWHLEHGKDVETSIMDGANQIVTPGFRLAASASASCSCRCSSCRVLRAFCSWPMAEAVMFAMIWSFPAVAHAGADHGEISAAAASASCRRRGTAAVAQPAGTVSARLRARFERVRGAYRDLLYDGDAATAGFRDRPSSGFVGLSFLPGAVSGAEFLSQTSMPGRS